MGRAYVTPAEKAEILVSLELVDKKDEELTRLIISNLVTGIAERNQELAHALINGSESEFYNRLNIVYSALAELTGLSEMQVEKLDRAIKGAETNVKKAFAAKTLSHIHVWYGMTNHREVFDFVMENCPDKKLLDAFEHFSN